MFVVIISGSIFLLIIPIQAFAVTAAEIQQDVKSELADNASTGDRAILLIYSNTDWSGALQDSTIGSATRDGSGNMQIAFQCSGNGIYSMSFQKQSEGGYLILVVIQNGKMLGSKETSAQYGVVTLAGSCESFNLNLAPLGTLPYELSFMAIASFAVLVIILISLGRKPQEKKK